MNESLSRRDPEVNHRSVAAEPGVIPKLFMLTLRPRPGVDGDRALKAAMKVLLRADSVFSVHHSVNTPRLPMLTLTDEQVKILTTVAQNIPIEKRGLLLERTAALMKFRSRSDADFRDALTLATVGLVQGTDPRTGTEKDPQIGLALKATLPRQ